MTAPNVTTSTPSATPTLSSTPPGTTAGATPAPWKAPAGSKFAGKSAEEILGIADALLDVMERAPAPAAAASPAPAAAAPTFGDDEYVLGRDIRRYMESRPVDTTSVDLAASAVLGVARNTFGSDFAKWGNEINATLNRLPKGQWTLDNIHQVVKMVRSDHVDEIAQEIATTRINAMEPTLRSTGGQPSAPVLREHSLESETIPAEWKRRALDNGVTESVVAEFCRANDMTAQEFYKQFEKPLNRIVEEHGKTKAATA